MDNFILKEIEKIYKELRSENEIRAGKRLEDIYRKYPELKEIDFSIEHENIRIALEIAGDGVYRDTSPFKQELLKRKKAFIQKNSISEDYNITKFNCNICKDTGKNENSTNGKCDCYKKTAYPVLISRCNFANIENYFFEKIDFSLYSDESDVKKYRTESSPRTIISGICRISEKFADNLNFESTRNLFFTGKPGTGKTFISGCTAHRAIMNGYSVYYLSAPSFFEKMSNYRVMINSFSPDPERYDTASLSYNYILNCDLLIIDDLGTEAPNTNRQPDLLSVLNYRTNLNKKMIISTNLEINNLSSVFDERVMSRIYGEFSVLRFMGEDLRHKIRQRS